LTRTVVYINQPHLFAIVQARRFSLFGHTAQMPDETDAKTILTAAPLENWRPPGHRGWRLSSKILNYPDTNMASFPVYWFFWTTT